MAERKTRTIEVLQHRGGGWDIREVGKTQILGYCDREIDAERKAREFVRNAPEARIVVRGESGRVYRQYSVTHEAARGKETKRSRGG